MNRLLVTGAGAETDLGFRSGPSFTQDTFYRRKDNLYTALESFYRHRLGCSRDGLIPTAYKDAFLLSPTGFAFKKLVSNIYNDCPAFLSTALNRSLKSIADDSSFSRAEYESLFKELIIESDDSDATRKQSVTLKYIPDDIHFGLLEQYYSALIEPNRHSTRFWKLVNFYWSAFFSIALPITDDIYGSKDSYNENRYAYVLAHLNDAVHTIFNQTRAGNKVSTDCYYSKLRGKFNEVLTTNYTPYAASVVGFDNSRISWLAGRLSQFEHLPELEFTDYSASDKHLGDNEFVFPYLLCQSPVKPVISLAQIREYAKAADALKEADEIVALGYSFCNEDAHISSMVGEALRSNRTKKLINFCHISKDTTSFDQDKALSELASKLRISETIAKEKIEIEPVTNCSSDSFQKRCSEWNECS